MSELSNLTSHELGNLRDQKIREKISLDEQRRDLRQEILNVMYEMDKLRLKKRELESKDLQLDFLIKKAGAEIGLYKDAFWSAKQGGI